MTAPLPKGFQAAAVHCGIKLDPAAEDLVLIHCPRDAVAAGVYTQNLVFAAPVAIDRERTPTEKFRVLVVNSGNANACTGDRGMEDARRMAEIAARSVGAEDSQALVMSTGIIGEYLPMEAVANGVMAAADGLGETDEHAAAASRGILTSDRGPKTASAVAQLSSGPVRVTGIAKGAGMIGPKMATMLAVITTDAKLSPPAAADILRSAVDVSFNRISVDGHTSTNDTALLIASGEAGEGATGIDFETLQQCIQQVCIDLAKMIPDDGEGASHLIQVEIEGAADDQDADRVARAVGDSPLVKTAVSGDDPNWGRIVSAAGYAGAQFDPNRVTLQINGTLLFQNGQPVPFQAEQVSRSMRENRQLTIQLSLGAGSGKCCYWASDLTCDYVTFNADYHT